MTPTTPTPTPSPARNSVASAPATTITPGSMAKEARERAGMSLAEAAKRLHITPRYLARLERGDYPITFGKRERMLFVYGSFQPKQISGGEAADKSNAALRESRTEKRSVRGRVAPLSPDSSASTKNRFAVSTNSTLNPPEGGKEHGAE